MDEDFNVFERLRWIVEHRDSVMRIQVLYILKALLIDFHGSIIQTQFIRMLMVEFYEGKEQSMPHCRFRIAVLCFFQHFIEISSNQEYAQLKLEFICRIDQCLDKLTYLNLSLQCVLTFLHKGSEEEMLLIRKKYNSYNDAVLLCMKQFPKTF